MAVANTLNIPTYGLGAIRARNEYNTGVISAPTSFPRGPVSSTSASLGRSLGPA